MTEIASPVAMDEPKSHRVIDGTARFVVIATMAFLTVVDLFAAQALLPTLVARYVVSPGSRWRSLADTSIVAPESC